jgi:hypothetical protein
MHEWGYVLRMEIGTQVFRFLLTLWIIQSVHFAGLLDVQNILSAGTMVSPGKLKVIHSMIT